MEVRYKLKKSIKQTAWLVSACSFYYPACSEVSSAISKYRESLLRPTRTVSSRTQPAFNTTLEKSLFFGYENLDQNLDTMFSCLEQHRAIVISVCRNWKSERYVQKKASWKDASKIPEGTGLEEDGPSLPPEVALKKFSVYSFFDLTLWHQRVINASRGLRSRAELGERLLDLT